MSDLLNVSSSPHVRSTLTTKKVMLYVIIALLPACFFGIYNFGFNAALLILVTTASCVATEYVFNLITKRKHAHHGGSPLKTCMRTNN